MTTKVEKLAQARVRCTVTIAEDKRAAAEEQALKRIGQQVKVKGFREGKAPANVVREQVKDEALLACFREGRALVDLIDEQAPDLKKRMLVVDFNAALKRELTAKGFHYAYADLAHADSLKHLEIANASLIICPLSNTFLKGTTTKRLLRTIRSIAPNARILMAADDQEQSEDLLAGGADQVLSLSQAGAAKLYQLAFQP